MNDTLNLKPCPFCGEGASLCNVMKGGKVVGYTATCDVCNVELGGCFPFKDAEDAARNWNVRNHSPSEIRVVDEAALVKIMLRSAAKTMNWEEGMKLAVKAIRPYLREPAETETRT